MAATTTAYHQPAPHFAPPAASNTPSVASLTSPRIAVDALRPRHDDASMADSSDSKTPTRPDFAGMAAQRPLPSGPFSPAHVASTPETERSDTDTDAKHHPHQDVEMGDDGDDGDSDNASANSDPQRPRKKKKGQRFFCTEYPPCNLSFTRSEHLARHVRKHTGERPFQCHCGRRFSRLDNLRQHAQTVHVNEEIPGDSLAATGTRFQRQIRTDRVRPPTSGRSRAGTVTSSISHARGHSRNLSASSITSNTSSIAPLSDDIRRRPPPLAMSIESTPRRQPETYSMPGGTPQSQYSYYHAAQQSPGPFSPPGSATFSQAPSSPGYSPTLSQRGAYYPTAPNARRLSVPSAPAPHPAFVPAYPSGPHHASVASVSSIASSRASVYAHSRRESDAAEPDWRRRTWHPSTYQRPATSGLAYHQTPDDARPTTANQPAASQVTRLPGIESFDHAPAPVRPPSPRQSTDARPDDRRSASVWEVNLNQNLNRLDITGNVPARAAPTGHARPALPAFSFPQAPAPVEPTPRAHARPMSGPEATSMANRRQGWYGGPLTRPQPMAFDRASPVESVSSDGIPTPSTSHGQEAHPAIHRNSAIMDGRSHPSSLSEAMHVDKSDPTRSDSASHLYSHERGASSASNYYDQRRYAPAPAPPSTSMGRLEALVAVATSENAHR